MQFHDAANMLPMLDDQALADLAEDIRTNGLREPIWLYDDKILDGRNRYCACLAAEVQPQYRTYLGDEPFSFVVSLNLHRRHLTYDQRVGLGLKIRPALAEEAKKRQGRRTDLLSNFGAKLPQSPGRSAEQAAKSVNVSDTAIKQMAAAEKDRPALADDLIAGKTTVKAVRAERNRSERVTIITQTAQPLDDRPERYPVIYADPPWRYDDNSTDPSRAIENQYPTMPLEELCLLPVQQIATPDAILFMWATNPLLAKAIRLIDAWGFYYQTNMVWVKDRIGMGYWVRQQHELLLIATRGNMPHPRPADRHASAIAATRTGHSTKPECFYSIIESMYPELPKIELFARSRRENWAHWGNQV